MTTAMTSPYTVVSLINGMIGGLILVLPVQSLQSGYVYTIIAIFFAAAFSFLSCYLSLKHMGDQKDMNYALYVHFGNNIFIKTAYDIVVWLGLFLGSLFYYELICIQWESILDSQSVLVPILNTVGLFFLIFVLKYFDFGATLMAYGVVSIFSYLIFLIWVAASSPSGNESLIPVGSNLFDFAATMSLAFAIQAFFIPVIRKNPNTSKHIRLTLYAYLIAICVYLYISMLGSTGIVNRISLVKDPQTIENYFRSGRVEVILIECIYLIHLYSCLPEFVLISKKRIFSILRIKQTKSGKIPIREIIYSVIFLGICTSIKVVGVRIDTIIAINGAFIGFFNIYFFPAAIHIKCEFFSPQKIAPSDKLENEIEGDTKEVELKITPMNSDLSAYQTPKTNAKVSLLLKAENTQRMTEQKRDPQQNNSQNVNEDQQNQQQQFVADEKPQDLPYFVCQHTKSPNTWIIAIQTIVILILVAIGAAIMVTSLMAQF